MAEKKIIPKFNLVKKADPEHEDSQETIDSQTPPTLPTKLTLRESGPQQPSPSTPSDEIHIEQIMEDAYAPDKERRRQSQLAKRAWKICFALGATTLAIFIMYAYAHIWHQWPLLEKPTWYLPFLVSIIVSLFACFKAYQVIRDERSYSTAISGICIAVALTYWSAVVFGVAAQPEEYAPDNVLWEAQNDMGRLLAYEINACRGWTTTATPYIQISMEHYKTTFRARPRSEWKHYFNSYLSADELSKTTSINIDEQMRTVSQRMLQKRAQVWSDFDAQYQAPDFLFKLKRWLILPYAFAFKHL